MKTYKIVAGAVRNSRNGENILSIEGGEEQLHLANVDLDTVIRIRRKDEFGGYYQIVSLSLDDIITAVSGL